MAAVEGSLTGRGGTNGRTNGLSFWESAGLKWYGYTRAEEHGEDSEDRKA